MYWQAECTQVDRSTWPQPACQIFYIAASNNHCVLQTREHNGSVGGIPPSTLSVLIRKINRFSFPPTTRSIYGRPKCLHSLESGRACLEGIFKLVKQIRCP